MIGEGQWTSSAGAGEPLCCDDDFFDEELLKMCDAVEMERGFLQPVPLAIQQPLTGSAPLSECPAEARKQPEKSERQGAMEAVVVPTAPPAHHEPAPPSELQPAPPPPQQQQQQQYTSIESLFVQLLDLPLALAESYKRRGVSVHYQWQEECLMQPGVIQGRNLLYSAPTSGGKSFVAEVLLLRRVLLTRKNALFVLPFVAVVREKVKHLRGLLTCFNNSLPKRSRIRIKAFHGGKGGRGLGRSHIGVCTMEKANALINKLIEEGKLSQLTCLILDELHMVADPHRGYLLEIMLSKLKYIRASSSSLPSAEDAAPPPAPQGQDPPPQPGAATTDAAAKVDIQIVGLSATLPNLQEIANWMDGTLYRTDFRPVQLVEHYVMQDKVFDGQGELLRTLPPAPKDALDPDRLTTLTRETVSRGDQVIIFCPSRRQCEACANILAQALLLTAAPKVVEERAALVKRLSGSPCSLDPVLARTLPEGVAFHHAGLTDEEKQGIEDGFRAKVLSVIVATSTLGAGVNLPAARVIFRTVKTGGGRPMEIASYRQMAGRAGRAGHMTYGESVLIAKNESEAKDARRLINDSLPVLQSCLWPESDGGRGLVRAIMEAVTSGALREKDSLDHFLRGTLMAQQVGEAGLPRLLSYGREALAYLCENSMVDDLEPRLTPTKLARALFHSCFAPDEGLVVFRDLVQAQSCLLLETDLHLLYLLTPVSHNLKPDFAMLWKIYQRAAKHEPAKARVFQLVGLDEARLDHWSRQPPGAAAQDQSCALLGEGTGKSKVLEGDKLRILRARRMWAALILCELYHEAQLEAVATHFQAAKGEVQAFQASATMFCGMVQAFLTQLGWTLLAKALAAMVAAISGQPSKELQPLCQLPHMRLKLAQVLFAADLRSVAAVAAEPEARLAELLRLSQPFEAQSRAQQGDLRAADADRAFRWLVAARRLKEAAHGVLEREDRQRKARLQALEAQWGGRPVTASGEDEEAAVSESEDDDDDDEAGNDASDASDEETDGLRDEAPEPVEGRQAAGDGPQDLEADGLGAAMHLDMVAAQAAAGDQAHNPYDTPMCVRQAHQHFRRVDFPTSPAPVTPLAPSAAGPCSPRHYLYKPHERRVSMSPPDADRAALHACTRAGVPVPPLSSKVSCDGFQARHVHDPRDVDNLLGRCRANQCFAFTLSFSAMPPRHHASGDDGEGAAPHPMDTLRFLLTSSIPEIPVRNAQQGGVGLLTGISLSLDGRQCYHISLPPPFRPRPFPTPCLGDDDHHPTTTDAAGRVDKQPRLAESPVPAAAALGPAQCVPERALQQVFGFLGFVHGPQHLEHVGGLLAHSSQSRNAAFVACRRWNRVACAWFNECVSRRTWSRLKAVMEAEGVTKVSWDMTTAMTALKERGITMAQPLEDPRVARWLLRLPEQDDKKDHLKLVLPPPETQVDFLAWPAGALLRLAASLEGLLESHRLMQPFRLTEMPLVPVLCELQFYGMRIVRSWFPEVLVAMQDRLLRLQELANAYGKCEVDLNSSDAVQNMLYAVLKLKPPPRWMPKSKVLSSTRGEMRKVELGPTSADMLALMVDQSPAVKVVLEYRSLSRTLGSLQTLLQKATSHYILGNHRVRPKADAAGSSTGRVILSDPCMQHVQRELVLHRSVRTSIQDELDMSVLAAAMQDDDDQGGGQAPAANPTEEWASYVGRPVAVLRATAHWGSRREKRRRDDNGTVYATSQLGVLREVLPRTIGETFEADGQPTRRSLADYWRGRGFAYSAEQERSIRQLCIEFRNDDDQPVLLTYPADKVFRQRPHISDPAEEAAKLFEQSVQHAVQPREPFHASDGFVLLSADYSQIEMRLLAHFSRDALLCQAFRQGRDVFQTLAASWKNIPESEVTQEVRDTAKKLAYATLYGQGPEALGRELGIARWQAQNLISDFHGRYPGLKVFAEQTRASCRQRGFVETLLGRRRYLPRINSDDSGEQARAERQALNTVCQGSAADLIKLAMINIHHHVNNTLQPRVDKAAGGKLGTLRALGVMDCRLVLQIHDELVYEVRADLASEMKGVIRRCMEGAVKLEVPLKVNLKEGTSWAHLTPVEG